MGQRVDCHFELLKLLVIYKGCWLSVGAAKPTVVALYVTSLGFERWYAKGGNATLEVYCVGLSHKECQTTAMIHTVYFLRQQF